MEWREVDGGLAGFHMSVGELTPFPAGRSVAASQRWDIHQSLMVFLSVEKVHVY